MASTQHSDPSPRGIVVRRALAEGRQADPAGHRIHLAMAAVFMAVLPLGMTPGAKDVMLITLAIFTFLRLPRIHRCYVPLRRDPLVWLIYAYPVWLLLSLTWSPAPALGIEEARVLRMTALPWLLWPVLLHYRTLITSFLVGCGFIVLVQLGQILDAPGLAVDIQGRADAAMQPIQAGLFLVTAAMWLLTGVLFSTGSRGRGLAAAFITIVVGLVLTGSRGPWISLAFATALLTLSTVVLARNQRGRVLRLATVAILAMAAMVIIDAVVLGGRLSSPVRQRVALALAETSSTGGDDHYRVGLGGWHRTPVGFRLLAWDAAVDVFLDHPLLGTGAGGLSSGLDARWWLNTPEPDAAGIPVSARTLNPHSSYLQILSNTGLIGLSLFLIPMVLALTRLVAAVTRPACFGTAFVLVAWMAGAVFESYHVMTTAFGILMVVFAAALIRPAARSEST